MSNLGSATADVARPNPPSAGTLGRLVLIGVVLAAIAAGFAYLGGWFSPKRLTPARFVDGFEEVNGVHSGFRRNHAKGVGVSGFFESNGNGVRLSKANVFQAGRVPVLGRFSLGVGKPDVTDTPGAARGLGLQFSPANGDVWRTAMINLPLFPFRTPQAFYEQLVASKADPKTGKPDPAKMSDFLNRHPETERVLGVLKERPVSSGFADSAYYGLNAFLFTNAAGTITPVRWVLTPEQPFHAAEPAASQNKNFLFDGLIADIHRKPLRWRLVLVVGQSGDPTGDATIAWPPEREKVEVGTLTLDRIESDDASPATAVNFDPLALPDGIAPSDDPILSARSAIYSQSFTRRSGEPKQPSAITTAEVEKGE
jgi:catalase